MASTLPRQCSAFDIIAFRAHTQFVMTSLAVNTMYYLLPASNCVCSESRTESVHSASKCGAIYRYARIQRNSNFQIQGRSKGGLKVTETLINQHTPWSCITGTYPVLSFLPTRAKVGQNWKELKADILTHVESHISLRIFFSVGLPNLVKIS